MNFYRERLWSSWIAKQVMMTDIPPAKAQLLSRTSDFDRGRTATWMAALNRPTWRAVHDGCHTIHVVSDRPFDALTSDLRLGLRIMAWISAQPITWYWWDQPWDRTLPAGVDPGPEHVNGGWAVPGVPEVHVYRREEAHKVLIHEAIHGLGLDVPEAAIAPVRAKFESALGRHLWPHLGEAFTEFMAEWLWAIASATSLMDAKNRWAGQLACSRRQAAEVWARIYDATAAEETNVFAYYVLKWVLMGHTETVLLSPDLTVGLWYGWWLAARPRLDSMARAAAHTEHTELQMGMTCGAASDS
jgi:hypothetical protein